MFANGWDDFAEGRPIDLPEPLDHHKTVVCANCGTESRGSANFCRDCGTVLRRSCSSCCQALPSPVKLGYGADVDTKEAIKSGMTEGIAACRYFESISEKHLCDHSGYPVWHADVLREAFYTGIAFARGEWPSVDRSGNGKHG